MNNNLPSPISNDNDLMIYREYLDCMQKSDIPNQYPLPIKNDEATDEITDGNTMDNIIGMNNTEYMKRMHNQNNRITDYLYNHIGKTVRIECLIGHILDSRIGYLTEVGNNYIVLRQMNCGGTMICNLDSVKYITIIHDNNLNRPCEY